MINLFDTLYISQILWLGPLPGMAIYTVKESIFVSKSMKQS